MLRNKGVRRALLVLGLALAAIPATASTALAGSAVGAVYVQTNTAPANFVRVFFRAADGTLTPGPMVATGGSGSATAPPLGLAITDSAGSVTLTENNNVLLVTNSGSNTISSFRVLPDGNIVLADQVSSGGVFPNSVTITKGANGGSLVYVLNENAVLNAVTHGTVSGFTLDRQGHLTPIPGSTRQISGGFNSAAIQFNQSGSVLTVTHRNSIFAFGGAPNGTISTWHVDSSTGLLGPEVVTPAIGSGAPFGLAYTNRDQLLVANNGTFEGGIGSTSAYDVDKQSAAVTARDDKFSGSVTCWVTITNNNQFAYATSVGPPGPVSLEGSVAGFRITPDTHLIPLFIQPTLGGGGLDLDTSVNSQYLFILTSKLDFLAGINAFIGGLPLVTPGVFPFLGSQITSYKIDNSTGSITPVSTADAGVGGNSGLASY
jgi:6-phosphogluconolactonase (cycloisomerase 2 family)